MRTVKAVNDNLNKNANVYVNGLYKYSSQHLLGLVTGVYLFGKIYCFPWMWVTT